MNWTRSARLYGLGAVLLIVLTIVFGRPEFFVPGLLLGLWVASEFLIFQYMLKSVVPNSLQLKRRSAELGDDPVIWAGGTITVKHQLQLKQSSLPIPLLLSSELLFPHGLRTQSKKRSGLLKSQDPWTWSQQIECPQAGEYHLDGSFITLFSPSGLFYAFDFVESPFNIKVYPNVFGWGQARPSNKQWNAMLQLGRHRFAFKGGNSDLLEIRDYQKGDSPKRIAWRLSARRDRILVKELERSVPLRTWIMIDAPSMAYLGSPGQRALDKVFLSAGQLTRTLLNDRDPVGLSLINAQGSKVVTPSAAQQQLFRVLGELTQLSTKQPISWLADGNDLSPKIEAWLQRRFPQLMNQTLNVAAPKMLPFFTRSGMRKHKIEQQLAAVMAILLEYPIDSAFALASSIHNQEHWSQLCSEFYRKFNLQFNLDLTASVRKLPEESEARLERWRRWLALRQNQSHDEEVWIIFLGMVDRSYHEFLKVFKVAKAYGHRLLVVADPVQMPADRSAEFLNQPQLHAKRLQQDQLFRGLINAARFKDYQNLKQELEKLAIPFLPLPDSVESSANLARRILQLKGLQKVR